MTTTDAGALRSGPQLHRRGDVLVLARADRHTAAAIAAYAFSCCAEDPVLAAELAAEAGAAICPPLLCPDGESQTTSPIAVMAAALAEHETGQLWMCPSLDGRRGHYIELATVAFNALAAAGAAVLSIPETGSPAVLYSTPLPTKE